MKEFAFWTKAEEALIVSTASKPVSEVEKIMSSLGFCRSKDSIAKKRRQLCKGVSVKTDYDADYALISTKFTQKPTVKPVYERTLVIGDAHTSPGQDLSRFVALGRYANTKKPQNIVFMGDFTNMDSLSKWDAGKEQAQGKLYKEDIKAAKEALRLFEAQLDKSYKPKKYFLGGNHDEGRVESYIESHAQLRGHMDFAEDMDLEEFGYEYIGYRKFLEIQGVLFTHAVMSAANTPVSGKTVMSTISALTAKSIVVGHHHRFEHASYARFGADDIQQVLLCGLFSEDTEKYADGAANSYARCIMELTHYKYGRFDVNTTSIERLKAEYL